MHVLSVQLLMSVLPSSMELAGDIPNWVFARFLVCGLLNSIGRRLVQLISGECSIHSQIKGPASAIMKRTNVLSQASLIHSAVNLTSLTRQFVGSSPSISLNSRLTTVRGTARDRQRTVYRAGLVDTSGRSPVGFHRRPAISGTPLTRKLSTVDETPKRCKKSGHVARM
jgi:hypothetical protein